MKKETEKPVKSSEPIGGWRLTMKDIPEKDRPYEKCEREGVGALTDAELLAILIRTGRSRHFPWQPGFWRRRSRREF